MTTESARRSVDWEVLLAIAASFAVGTALEKTGAAREIADGMITLARGNPWVSLAVIYGVTLVVTELITNNAAAALMFPFAMDAARGLEVNYMPFVVAVMMAASAGFSDYVKIGVPLDILVGVVTVLMAPLIWPF